MEMHYGITATVTIYDPWTARIIIRENRITILFRLITKVNYNIIRNVQCRL